jgi:hypothetical protein
MNILTIRFCTPPTSGPEGHLGGAGGFRAAGDMTTRKQRSVVSTRRAGFAWPVVGNDGAFPSKISRSKLRGIKPIMNEF